MIKRASLYLRRKYKRTILLLILLFVLAFSLAVGLSMWGSVNTVTKDVQDRLGTGFVFKMPPLDPMDTTYYQPVHLRDGGRTKAYVGATLDKQLADEVMGIDGVSAYNGEMTQWIQVEDIELYPGAMEFRTEDALVNHSWMSTIELNYEDMGGFEYYQTKGSETTVYGNTDTNLYDKFRTGAFELIAGRHITATDKQKVLISDELAERNQLDIGDTFHISLWNKHLGKYDPFDQVLGSWELEIVGIFHVNGYQPTGIWVHEDKISYNWLLSDEDTVAQINRTWDLGRYTDYVRDLQYENLTFFVDDADKLQPIMEQVEQLDVAGIGFFELAADDTMYSSTVEPLNSIKTLALAAMAIIMLGCLIVLCIVFTMWIRSRRREIAIYLSLGIRKVEILGQFIIEAAVVAVAASVVAFAVCQPVANAIGNSMLSTAVAEAAPEEKVYSEEELYELAVSGDTTEEFALDSGTYAGPEYIDFQFGLAEMLILVAAEFLIIIAAICKGGSFIFKLQPRQIMTTLS